MDEATELEPLEQVRLLLKNSDEEPSPERIRALLPPGSDMHAFVGFHPGKPEFDTVLMLCIDKQYRMAARTLLEIGADPNQQSMAGSTAMHRVCEKGHLDMLNDLVKFGGKVMLKDRFGDVPFHRACQASQPQMLPRLKELGGVDVNVACDHELRHTPLLLAIQNAPYVNPERVQQVVQWLVDEGADVHRVNSHGISPVLCAAEMSSYGCMKILLQAGGDPDACNPVTKKTALQWAASHNNLPLVELLVNEGAHLDACDHDGTSAMSIAAQLDAAPVIRFLGKMGADTELANLAGLKAADWADRNKSPDAMEALLDIGARLPGGTQHHLVAARRQELANQKWDALRNSTPPDVASVTTSDLVLFANIGALSKALALPQWQQHPDHLRELLLHVVGSVRQNILYQRPDLSLLLAKPDCVVSDWNCELASNAGKGRAS